MVVVKRVTTVFWETVSVSQNTLKKHYTLKEKHTSLSSWSAQVDHWPPGVAKLWVCSEERASAAVHQQVDFSTERNLLRGKTNVFSGATAQLI